MFCDSEVKKHNEIGEEVMKVTGVKFPLLLTKNQLKQKRCRICKKRAKIGYILEGEEHYYCKRHGEQYLDKVSIQASLKVKEKLGVIGEMGLLMHVNKLIRNQNKKEVQTE